MFPITVYDKLFLRFPSSKGVNVRLYDDPVLHFHCEGPKYTMFDCHVDRTTIRIYYYLVVFTGERIFIIYI